jgi:enoyl-CoA hydratase/carnithine racemase
MSLTFEKHGAVGLLTLDNPSRGNALTPADMLALGEMLDEASAQVRALVIRGAGDRVFCSGYDLATLPAVQDGDGDSWSERFPELVAAVSAHRRFPWPMVACLNGHAIGGGGLLATLCDLRVARPGVRFQIPASRIGVMYPLEGLRRLVSLVGQGRAAEILLDGGPIDTDRGLAWGLYNALDDDPEGRAMALAEGLASRAPFPIQGIKSLMLALEDGAGEGAVQALHAQWTKRCVLSTDLAEGVAAVQGRRPPNFQGR